MEQCPICFSEFKKNMEKATAYYLKGHKRFDPYIHPMDKTYLSDIERELKSSEQRPK